MEPAPGADDADDATGLRLHEHCLFKLGIHLAELWYFGELAPMFGLARSATARAAGPTVVTGIPLTEFRTHMRTATKAP